MTYRIIPGGSAVPLRSIRPYTDALRRQGGWLADGDSRAGGGRVVMFKKQATPTRSLSLQLWHDGTHRISHMEDGRGTTEPTEFTDIASMLAAIEREAARPSGGPFVAFLPDRFSRQAEEAIAGERARQIAVEGWSAQHDDRYRRGQLWRAAEAYFGNAVAASSSADPPPFWPWARRWWKPKGKERDLIKAGALYRAEQERLLRLRGRDGRWRSSNNDFAARAGLRNVTATLAAFYRARCDG